MYKQKPQLTDRQVSGLRVLSLGNHIKRKNKIHYKVQSQSDDGIWYDIVKQYGHNIQEGKSIDLDSWNEIILVDRTYFLEHKQEIEVWASQE